MPGEQDCFEEEDDTDNILKDASIKMKKIKTSAKDDSCGSKGKGKGGAGAKGKGKK